MLIYLQIILITFFLGIFVCFICNNVMFLYSLASLQEDERLKSVESPQAHTGHVIRMKNVPSRITDQDIFDVCS